MPPTVPAGLGTNPSVLLWVRSGPRSVGHEAALAERVADAKTGRGTETIPVHDRALTGETCESPYGTAVGHGVGLVGTLVVSNGGYAPRPMNVTNSTTGGY